MGLRTPILLTALAELAVFGLLCQHLGFWITLLMLVASSAAGGFLLRNQGITKVMRIQRMMEQGQSPVLEVLDALWLAAAGVLLLIPGFLTTLAALAVMAPFSRRLVGLWLIGRYRAYAGGPIHVHSEFNSSRTAPQPAQPNPPNSVPPIADMANVIDVEFEDIPPNR